MATEAPSQSPPSALVNRLLKAVPFLKAWAADPAQPANRIASMVGLGSASYVYDYIIPDFVNMYDAAQKQEDFPSNILAFYNQTGSQAPEHILTATDVNALKPVYEREKERITNKLQQQSQTFMSNPNFATGTRPPHTAMLNPGVASKSQTNIGTNATLISSIMENIRLAPLGQIPKFLKIFEQAEDFYMTHPVELEELFKSQFGPMPGTVGFRQFMVTQPYYVYNAPRAGGGGYPPFVNPAGSTYSSGLGPSTVSGSYPRAPNGDPVLEDLARQEMLDQNKEERRMRYMQNMASTVSQAAMMNMMQRSMESKQPIGMEALQYADIQEEYDAAGNLVGKKIMRRADGGGGSAIDRSMSAILELYKLQLQHAQDEKLEILKRSNEPSGLLTTAFNSILQKQMNPLQESISLFKGLKEIGVDAFGGGQNMRTREVIDSENDWKLALMHEDVEIAKMKHEWDIQSQANADSKEQMIMFVNALTEVTKTNIMPKVGKFIDGWLGGEKPQEPPQGPGPQHMHAHHQQGPPPQQQHVPPGSILVMTEQGPMWMKMNPQGPQPRGPPQGMGMPGAPQEQSFDELEEGRVMRQAEHLSRVAQDLSQREAAVREYEASLAEKENQLAQASAYIENRGREVNAEKQQMQFQRERQSFEEYTKNQLQDEFKAMQARMEKIQQTIQVKEREEKEYKEQEVKDAQELDTEPIAVAGNENVYQGEYEEDRSAAVKARQNTIHTNPVLNQEDQEQPQPEDSDTASE